MVAYVKALGLGVHRHGVVGKCRPSFSSKPFLFPDPDEDEVEHCRGLMTLLRLGTAW